MPPNDPYARQLLEKIAQETDENNKMLKSIRSYVRWSRIYSFFKLIVVLVLIGLSYYQLRPYFSVIQSGFYSIVETGRTLLYINPAIHTASQNGKKFEEPAAEMIQNILNRVKIPSEAPTSTSKK